MSPDELDIDSLEPSEKSEPAYRIFIALFLILVYSLSGYILSQKKEPKFRSTYNIRVLKSGDYGVRVALLMDKTLDTVGDQDYVDSVVKAYSKGLPDPKLSLRIAVVYGLFAKDYLSAKKNIQKIKADPVWYEILGVSKFRSNRAAEYVQTVKKADLGPLELPLLASLKYKSGDKIAGDKLFQAAHDNALERISSIMAMFAFGVMAIFTGVVFLILGILKIKELPAIKSAVYGSNIDFFIRYLVVFGLASIAARYVFGPRTQSPLYFAVSVLFIQLISLTQLDIRNISRRFGNFALSWRQIGLGIAGSCSTLPIHVFASLLSYMIFKHSIPQDTYGQYITAGGLASGIMVAVIVFIGPFVEEIAFRGLLLDSLLEKMSYWPAAIVCSAAFALLHLDFAFKFVPIFCFALILCYLRRKTGSLTSSYIAHVANNALVTSVFFVY